MNKPMLAAPLIIVCVGMALGSQPAHAQALRYVDNLTSCASFSPCYAKIQDAVDASGPNDVVAVFPGAYHESVAISSKNNLTVRSILGRLEPVILEPPNGDAVQIAASPGTHLANLAILAPQGAAIMVVSAATSDVVIQNVFARSANGVQFRPAIRARLSGNTIVGGGIGFLTGAESCVVERNTLVGAGIGFSEGLTHPDDNIVRNNVIEGGDIGFGGRGVSGNTVEGNFVRGGNIGFSGVLVHDNTVRGNTVVGGGITLFGDVRANAVEANSVSGSPQDGIFVQATDPGSPNAVRRNTSVDSAQCDIDDASSPNATTNTWEGNRFVTKCGSATD